MAAGIHVTGPILHCVSFPGEPSKFFFLGTAKETPLIRIDRHYMPILMEQGGYVVPFDLSYQGKESRIITQLNYFDPGITYALGCSPRYSKSKWALGKGLESFKDIGSLVLGDKCYFTLVLLFPFSLTPNEPMTAAIPGASVLPRQIVPYFMFPASIIEHEEETGGTGENGLTLAIYSQRIWYSRAVYANVFNTPLAGGFWHFDNYNFTKPQEKPAAGMSNEDLANISLKIVNTLFKTEFIVQ